MVGAPRTKVEGAKMLFKSDEGQLLSCDGVKS